MKYKCIRKLKGKLLLCSLNTQIKLVNSIIVISTMITIIIITYIQILEERDSKINLFSIMLKESVEEIDLRINLVEKTMNMISNDPRILNYTEYNDSSISKVLDNWIDFNEYEAMKYNNIDMNIIDNIIFIPKFDSQASFIKGNDSFVANEIEKQIGYKRLAESKKYINKNIWTDYFVNNYLNSETKKNDYKIYNFMVIRNIYNGKENKDIGYMAISINLEKFSQLIDNVKIDEKSNIYILDSNNKILASDNRSKILHKLNVNNDFYDKLSTKNDYFKSEIKNSNYYIFTFPLDFNDYRMIVTIPVSELSKSIYTFWKAIFLVGFIVLILIMLISGVISNNLSSPLSEVLDGIKQIRKGNLNKKLNVKGCIEVKELSSEYNYMLIKINNLLSEIKKEQQTIRKAELKALKSQINPHFLYNTLATIKGLISLERKKTAIDLTISLSKYYRLVLSNGKDEISIEDEIQHINEYLYIMRLRYGDRLDYYIHIDDINTSNYSIPNLILQPIIENSIIHGIDRAEISGKIDIYINKKSNNKIEFIISDNGIGMTDEQLKNLEKMINDSNINSQGSYALKNVNQRIKLFFDNTCNLNFQSIHGKGTKVYITIPKKEYIK
jgi:two-component system sensor histidine kinase YesM